MTIGAEPPGALWLTLEEGLGLLAGLEDARDALILAGRLSVVVGVEDQIRLISRRLGFEDPEGGADGR
ncbi:MAG TPA: hypothetical protein VNG13_06870 [Mycobacteriales bacterium]|nr:hypothetical protein [Mycobacteriales bacterium]